MPRMGGPTMPVCTTNEALIVPVDENSLTPKLLKGYEGPKAGTSQLTSMGKPSSWTVGCPGASLHSTGPPTVSGAYPDPVTVSSWPFKRPVVGLTLTWGTVA